MKRLTFVLWAVALIATAEAQLLRQVKDINPLMTVGGSGPQDFTQVGDIAFFTAADQLHGREWWTTDGTTAGTRLVRDIFPGKGSGGFCNEPSGLDLGAQQVNFNGTLFFAARDHASGFNRCVQLWKSDGSLAGTVQVFNFNGDNVRQLTVVNNTLFFAATGSPDAGNELWKSDGTTAGTVPVKDLVPGSADSYLEELTAWNGKLWFRTRVPGIPDQETLWMSDGTELGTVPIKTGFQFIDVFTVVNDKAFFRGQLHPATITTLWMTDGTEAGTVELCPSCTDPQNLTSVNGTLFFTIGPGQLWRSDGTPGGTVMLKDFCPSGCNQSNARSLVAADSVLFFIAATAEEGQELWRSDGTTAGTVMVKDVVPGPDHGVADTRMAYLNGAVYFRSDGLWKSDGSEAGTIKVKDLYWYDKLTAVSGLLLFQSYTPETGTELWKSDGTEAGTALVSEIGVYAGYSMPENLIDVNGTLFFTANDGVAGPDLWKSDGTAAGTVLVKEICPGVCGNPSAPIVPVGSMVEANGTLFFAGYNGSTRGLWRSNGTAAGTFQVRAFTQLSDLTDVNGTVFFVATTPEGEELWKSDGTLAGTVLVNDLCPGACSSYPTDLIDINGTLFFFNGFGLYKSDGTAAGTILLKANLFVNNLPGLMLNVNGTLFCGCDSDDGTGSELWKSDGTPGGTVRVKDINPGPTWSFPHRLTLADGTLFFAANSPDSGFELWTSDGTDAGTVMLKDINPGPSSSVEVLEYFLSGQRRRFASVGGTVFFEACEPTAGCELWKSDGTNAGTTLVKDVVPGSYPSFPSHIIGFGGRVYYGAIDMDHGYEVWTSDGTAAGTFMIQDTVPGFGDFPAYGFTASGSRLFFNGNDPTTGFELWAVEP